MITGNGKKVTGRKTAVFMSVASHIIKNGWAPSYEEICKASGIPSKSTVKPYLLALEAEGLITLGCGARKVGLTREGERRAKAELAEQ